MSVKSSYFIYFGLICIFSVAWFLYSVTYGTKNAIIEREVSDSDVDVYELNIKEDKLFNVTFKYLINNRVCGKSNKQIKAIILVTSYYGNIETRSAMRRTFSNEDLKALDMRRVFLIAQPPQNDKSLNHAALLNENERFGDLIQGNFIEAYRNLTYKHVMGLQWAAKFCSNAKFVIKMDDDIVVDMYKMPDYIQKLTLTEKRPIAGFVFRGMVPIREPQNKWYVTKEEYPLSTYPPFVSGWFYITTPRIASLLSKLARSFPYFWIDDVFITGVLMKKVKLKFLDIRSIFAVHAEYLECCMRDLKLHNYDCPYIVGPNGGNNNLFFIFNEMMVQCSREKCLNRPDNKPLNATCVAEKKLYLGRGKGLIETMLL